MFQFRRFPTYAYLIQRRLTEYCSAGFPHSEISGSMLMCSSPKLIAACHVLHRLLMPRHSPCALYSLTLLSVCTERSRSGSQAFELCRLRVLRNCLCYPSKSSTNHFCFPLLLALHTWLLCSVFKVRFLTSFETRCKHLQLNACIQSRRNGTTHFSFGKMSGGPKWTRTTDLTIISRAL